MEASATRIADPKVTAYLYDVSGEWIAFRPTTDSRYLFDVRGTWIGWYPVHVDEVLTQDGDYLGNISGDRLIQRFDYAYRGTPGYPGAPAFSGVPRPSRLPARREPRQRDGRMRGRPPPPARLTRLLVE